MKLPDTPPTTYRRRGFALILSLLILALLVVTVVGSSLLLQVEVRTADNSRQITEARQNAVYGLGIALGELQSLAGPDQRITAPATAAYPAKDVLTTIYKNRAATAPRKTYLTPGERDLFDADIKAWWNGKNPRWTGVWDSSLRRDPGVGSDKFGEPKRDQLPRWLISGNEGKDPSSAADYVTPDTTLADPASSQDVVWLVGEGSATKSADSSDGLDGRVKAPRIPIMAPGTAAPTGHYAYWVGDESTKANFAVHDPFANEDLTPKSGNEEGTKGYRNRLQVPQRIGWENLAGFAPLFGNQTTDVKPNDNKLGKIVTNAQIPLLDTKFRVPAKASFHQLTAYSSGVLTDAALGGLKKDLTVFLESGAGLTGSQPIPNPSNYAAADPRFGTNTGFPGTVTGLPDWGKIKSWHDNSTNASGTGVVSVSPEFAPVVTSYRFFLAFTHQNGRLQLHIMPVITLWNPFDAPLASTTYTLKVRHNFPLWKFGVATSGTVDPTDDGEAGFQTGSSKDLDGFVQNGYFVHKLAPYGWYANSSKYNTAFNTLWMPGFGPTYTFAPFDLGATAPLWSNPNATWVSYTFTVGFDPGESKVLSVRADPAATDGGFQQVDPANLHSGSQSVVLKPGFDSDFPASYYFDFATFVETGTPGQTVPDASKTVRFFGESAASTNLGYFSMKLMAGTTLLWENPSVGFMPSNNWNKHLNANGNALSAQPATWRRVYELDAFKALVKGSNDTSVATSPVFPWFIGYFTPFSIKGWELPDTQRAFQKYMRAFAVTNPAAPVQGLSGELEGGRDVNATNNTDHFGIMSVFFAEAENSKWQEDQSNEDNGFSLISWKKFDDRDNINNTGLSVLPIRSVKRADSEVLSLGQFQQVNLSPKAWQPAFPAGNSEASPWVDRGKLAGITSYSVGAATLPQYPTVAFRNAKTFPNNAANDFVDMSFLLNENLWDGYFLSAVPQSGALSLNNTIPLSNSRHRFRLDADFGANDVRDFDHASAFLENVGAFNVNSTSVDAWKALFTAFRGLRITGATDSKKNPPESIPVSRSLDPVTGPLGFSFSGTTPADIGANPAAHNYSQLFTGFRYLTDDMIDALAKRIVDEVRLRGPFLSLADFVNRRLVSPDGAGTGGSAWQTARTSNPSSSGTNWNNTGRIGAGYDPVVGLQGLNGALQRAINVSGINGGANYPLPAANNDRVFYTTAKGADIASLQPMELMSDCAYYLDTEHLTGTPAGEIGQLLSHTPGFVTQADLLAMIGPALTARGDTFLIRSYGDAVNPKNQKIQTRAWL